jgi:flagellar hook-length control protein FliK
VCSSDLSPPAPPAALDLHGPRLPDQLGQAVVWSLGEQLSEVSLEVNPGELGPLSLQLRLEDERVSLRIGVTQAAVAEVVQGSLGTLAGLLQARGLHLEQAQVYAQSRPPTPAAPTRGQASTEGVSLIQTPRVIRRRGLIDDFV